MTIEHVALFVKDLENAKDFFVRFLNGKANDGYRNESNGFASYFISFEDGARLEIMNKPALLAGEKSEHFGYSHIAFSVGSKEKVDELTEQIRAAGYEVVSGPRTTGDGYYESCCAVIEGNRIELTV